MNNDYESYFRTLDVEDLMECTYGYPDRNDCSWYHNNWMTLRVLGMVSNPFWHEHFYIEQLKTYYISNSKVLVLGTADFSMPLLCMNAGITKLDICDLCKTPLNICRTIAERNQFEWKTFVADINEGINDKYNIIINDAFLSRFNYDEKPKILKNIGQALFPGGVYITTIRHDWNYGKPVIPTNEQKENFIQRAIKLAEENGYDTNLIRNSASIYIKNMISYPMKDKEAIEQIVAGVMNVEKCSSEIVTGECVPTEYFRVVFRK